MRYTISGFRCFARDTALVMELLRLRFVRYRSALETKFAAMKREQHRDSPGSRSAIAATMLLEPLWFMGSKLTFLRSSRFNASRMCVKVGAADRALTTGMVHDTREVCHAVYATH